MRFVQRAVPLLATATTTFALAGAPAGATQAHVSVAGGSITTIDQAPWQVAVRHANALCGGVILDATRVLTAAHCSRAGAAAPPSPPSAYSVQAGFSNMATWAPGMPVPARTQVVGVSAKRLHPYYDPTVKRADVMLLTLAAPLDLSGPAVQAIALPGPGTAVRPGTPLVATGFGQTSAVSAPDGLLRSVPVTMLADDSCRSNVRANSGVVLCAQAAPGTGPCLGDSGGPLVAPGAPAVLVGLTSYAGYPTCGTGQDVYSDITAGEIRAFIDGRPQIPRAPRVRRLPTLRSRQPAVQGSAVTCEHGRWTGSPKFTYIFKDDRSRVLRKGRSRVYVPRAAAVGRSITCVVEATNAGGTAVSRTPATGAVRRAR